MWKYFKKLLYLVNELGTITDLNMSEGFASVNFTDGDKKYLINIMTIKEEKK